MLRNSEATIGGLQLSLASYSKVMKQSKTTIVSSSNDQFYPESRLGLDGAGHNKQVRIVTPMVEQILINLVWINDIVG